MQLKKAAPAPPATQSCAIISNDELALLTSRTNQSPLATSAIEHDHVFKVYDSIATHWHHTRGLRKVHWNIVKSFIEKQEKGALLADVGCGDGKYFGLNKDIISIGCDRSHVLLEVSRKNGHDSNSYETFSCDAVFLPFRR